MTEQQTRWLAENPAFEPVRHLGVASIYQYADEGYLLRNGQKVDGEMRSWPGLTIISSNDTLYTNVKGAVRVGRRYMMV